MRRCGDPPPLRRVVCPVTTVSHPAATAPSPAHPAPQGDDKSGSEQVACMASSQRRNTPLRRRRAPREMLSLARPRSFFSSPSIHCRHSPSRIHSHHRPPCIHCRHRPDPPQDDLFDDEDEDEPQLSEAEPSDDEGEGLHAAETNTAADEGRLEGRWQDGMLVTFLRQFETDADSVASGNAKPEESSGSKERAWLILDGDMYGDWAESLSGMVVKRTLFLSNGEPLQLPPNLTVVVEAQDAANASPTLHTHCAVLALSSQTIGWKATLRAWARREEQVPVSSTRQLQRWG